MSSNIHIVEEVSINDSFTCRKNFEFIAYMNLRLWSHTVSDINMVNLIGKIFYFIVKDCWKDTYDYYEIVLS